MSCDGKDVTNERMERIGNFVGYKIKSSSTFAYFKPSVKSVPITEDIRYDDYYDEKPISEICKVKPDFCLTVTEEDIHTNGCPAYVYPFHYRDAVDCPGFLEDTKALAVFYKCLFGSSHYLPITANAGIHNPGASNRVVFENITKGRNLEKYFMPNEPFGFVIPVSFADGTVAHSYNGQSKNQQSINVY